MLGLRGSPTLSEIEMNSKSNLRCRRMRSTYCEGGRGRQRIVDALRGVHGDAMHPGNHRLQQWPSLLFVQRAERQHFGGGERIVGIDPHIRRHAGAFPNRLGLR